MAWRKILALGLVAGVAFAGCTVTTDDDDDDDGGNGNTGGSSTGGKASGGAGTGGKGSGGTSAGGSDAGSGGSTDDAGRTECRPEAAGKNECEVCVETKCCQEWLDCGDDVNCSYKPATGEPGELRCIQDCLIDQIADSGISDLGECAGICAEESSGVSSATSDFIACIRTVDSTDGGVLQNCSTSCFGTEL